MHLKRRTTRSAAAALVAAAAAVAGAVPANGSDVVAPHQGHHVGPPQLSGPGNPPGHDPAAPTEEATLLDQMDLEELERGPQRSSTSERAEGPQGTVKAQCEVTSPNPALRSLYRANLTLDYAQHPTQGHVTFRLVDHRLEVPDPAMGREGATITMSAPGGVTTTAPLTQTASSVHPTQGSGWNIFPPSQFTPVAGPTSSTSAWQPTSGPEHWGTTLSIRVDFDHKPAIWPIPIFHLLYATWKDTYCTIDIPWEGEGVSLQRPADPNDHWWSDKG